MSGTLAGITSQILNNRFIEFISGKGRNENIKQQDLHLACASDLLGIYEWLVVNIT